MIIVSRTRGMRTHTIITRVSITHMTTPIRTPMDMGECIIMCTARKKKERS